ncbi:MAG: succinyl-diaminopimelate desuccinylase [Alphaproteobacteria bacterium]|nr:succinyl-diaminopimelate desuccinylase [Alphaproteobacteria bacterium]|tara:strand:+ start:2975 stop:4138 length:1164 start_codon:yes stop_codon:yes gene_type:complete
MSQSPEIDAVELAASMIRCPSVTPADAGALGVLEGALEVLGFTCHRLPFSEPRAADVENLFARLGSGSPVFCFAGHTDVVPVGDQDQWKSDPFSGEVRDGVLYGRGAADMKGAIACFVSAVSRFLEGRENSWLGSICLLITGDEEGPAINGTRKVLKWMADNGHEIDACLVGEPTNPENVGDMIKIGRRGSMMGRLTIEGTQGHAAYPHLADNPIPRLVSMLRVLTETSLDDGNEHFQPSTITVTSVDVGNPATNVIPATARATFNIRFNDTHTGDSLEAWLREQFDQVGGAYDLAVSVSGEAFLTKAGTFSETVAGAVERVLDVRPELSTSGGTSDARFIKDYAEVAEFGLVGRTMHKVDECIALTDLDRLTKVYIAILEDYFATA